MTDELDPRGRGERRCLQPAPVILYGEDTTTAPRCVLVAGHETWHRATLANDGLVKWPNAAHERATRQRADQLAADCDRLASKVEALTRQLGTARVDHLAHMQWAHDLADRLEIEWADEGNPYISTAVSNLRADAQVHEDRGRVLGLRELADELDGLTFANAGAVVEYIRIRADRIEVGSNPAAPVAESPAEARRRARRVIIESPYAGDVERNLAYLHAAMADCFARGEAPFASHGLYPQVLDDNDAIERGTGILAGLAWGEVADVTVVYTDLGTSPGMRQGIEAAERAGRPVERRSLEDWDSDEARP